MKKHFKKRHLYFFITNSYPENLNLQEKPLWPKHKILPNYKKNLRQTIQHLKKTIFSNKNKYLFAPKTFKMLEKKEASFINKDVRGDSYKKNLRDSIVDKKNEFFFQKKRKEFYPLFTFGQGTNHVLMSQNIFRKVSHFYTSLVEKKKFCILYGLSNQKKLSEQIQKNGKFSLSICERKIDVLLLKTGLFPTIAKAQMEINHKRVCCNESNVLSFSIQCQPGDLLQIRSNGEGKNPYLFAEGFYKELKEKAKRFQYPLFFGIKNLQQKKVFIFLKKLFFYKKFLEYKGSFRKKIYKKNPMYRKKTTL